MGGSSKAAIAVLVIGAVAFGCSQIASASQIGVAITHSELLEEGEHGSSYGVELRFDNPSLLILGAGESEFFVVADGELAGEGRLEPFVLPALGSSLVKGTFETDSGMDPDDPPTLKISGLAEYDVLLASIGIPFVFHPTEEQTREFIDGG